jgi:hypothetical protein
MATDQTLQPGESVKLTSTTPITTTGSGSTTVTAKAGAAPTPTPDPTPTPTPTPGEGVLISKAELMAVPMSGNAWSRVQVWASKSISTTDMLKNQDSAANVTTLAAALVAVRKGDSAMRGKVVTALKALKGQPLERALALGRELGAYVIASDLIGATDAEVGYDQKAFYRGKLTQSTSGGPSSLIACAKGRPNNWGTHAMGAVACVYSKYGTAAELDELYKWVKGWLGDRATYKGFTYGDLSWQADSANPVGVNPKGATKQGHSIDGVLPDDQRRAGGFSWPPPNENYVYEALQGALLAALVLERTGRPVASLQSEALYRAYRWLVDVNEFPVEGDDTWEPWALRKLYPAHAGAVVLPSSSTPGKNLGYTDWLYA